MGLEVLIFNPMKTLKVLIGCEFSGIVREAFNSYHGVHAISCDLLPAEDGRVDYHYQGDVMDIINDGWDLGIFHTPCTFLCNSGVRWLYKKETYQGIPIRNRQRWVDMERDALFFRATMESNIPYIANENPIPHRYAMDIIGRKYDQIIQPWQFGHTETKATCLWLKNLPLLIPTSDLKDKIKSLPKKETQRIHYMSPGINRQMERSRTYQGIAAAMADQWIKYILKQS